MNDEKMIKAIKAGDETAIDAAINKYSKLMWPIVSVVLNPAASMQDVEECVADIFVYLWQNSEKYDASTSNLKYCK